MNVRVVINFEHVECMKLTSETTVYVRFASGTAQTFEFNEPVMATSMTLAFENWCEDHRRFCGYVLSISQDGKAGAR